MKEINFNQEILNLEGQPLKMGEDVLTLKNVAITALLNSYPSESIDAAEKARRYKLAKFISEDKAALIPTGERDLIKELVGRTFGPPVVGPVFELLEPGPGEPFEVSAIDLKARTVTIAKTKKGGRA